MSASDEERYLEIWKAALYFCSAVAEDTFMSAKDREYSIEELFQIFQKELELFLYLDSTSLYEILEATRISLEDKINAYKKEYH